MTGQTAVEVAQACGITLCGFVRATRATLFTHPERVRIALDLSTGRTAELVIVDPAGRRIRRLHTGRLSGGETEIIWDGRDENGVEVGSGVYFCRMEAEEFNAATKMVLLK